MYSSEAGLLDCRSHSAHVVPRQLSSQLQIQRILAPLPNMSPFWGMADMLTCNEGEISHPRLAQHTGCAQAAPAQRCARGQHGSGNDRNDNTDEPKAKEGMGGGAVMLNKLVQGNERRTASRTHAVAPAASFVQSHENRRGNLTHERYWGHETNYSNVHLNDCTSRPHKSELRAYTTPINCACTHWECKRIRARW